MSYGSRTFAPVVVTGPSRQGDGENELVVGDDLRVISSLKPNIARTPDGTLSCWLVGNALYGKQALLSGAHLASALEAAGSARSFIAQWGTHAKNPCAGIFVDHAAKRVFILADPLGGCLVFFYTAGGHTFVSPDLECLVTAAAAYGLKPQKSLAYQVERTILGNGGLTPASYAGVEALPMMEYAAVSRDGLEICALPAKSDYLAPGLSYATVMDAYRQDVLDSIEAIAQIEGKKISHLTGGFDSRLVLGGIMGAAKQDEFVYFCSGPVGTADRDTADGLSASLGLTRTHDAGLSNRAPSSVEDKFLAPMSNSSGLTSSGPLGGEIYNGRVVAGGGYGGLLRSVYSTLAPGDPDQMSTQTLAEKFWGAPALVTGGLMTDVSKERILERLALALKTLQSDGYEDDYLGDAFYLTQRNRYHFGQNSMLWSRVGRRYDPLYSIHGPRLARMLPIYSRRTNVAGFDLMSSLQAELLSYAFDRDRFTGNYSSLRRVPEARPFAGLPPRFEAKARTTPAQVTAVDQVLRKKQIALSRKMGVNFWQIESMAAAQAGLSNLLKDIDVTDMAGEVNPDYVRFLAKDPLRTRMQIRHLYAVYSMLLWYTKP